MTKQEFIKVYGEGSIEGNILIDNSAYYKNKHKSRFVKGFEFPEGITSFETGFGLNIATITKELLSSIPKSVEDISWLGKNATAVHDGVIIRADIRQAYGLTTSKLKVKPVLIVDEISRYRQDRETGEFVRTNPEVALEIKGLRWSKAKNLWEIGETDAEDNFTYIEDQV